MPKIHSTAVIDPKAVIADDVEIGPLCYVGPNVKIGNGSRLLSQCNIDGYTTLGENNTVHPFAALGQNAQDLSYAGGETFLEIGNGNTFREGATVHCGTKPGTKTVIGDNCYFMNHSHVAHNCIVGSGVIMVNSACAAGYVRIGDRAILSAYSAIHQFCRVGRLVMVSACSVFSQDIAPFVIAEGRNGTIKGINVIGCKRAGISVENIKVLRELFKIYFLSGLNATNAVEKIRKELPQTPEVLEFIDFLNTSERGISQGRNPERRA
ncbi:MAG: acyl-ACP--UDP-N-acetylglucosamine O-acyltransferase [Victivallaceae bacterium]|nr:acyl-ACP--UDP-N-acetylglucosamine O-acyltransferase [Victivallaceae bacterium]